MPAFVRALFIKSSTEVELSYCMKKNPACRILRLRRVALATLFHSAAVRSLAERFLCHRTKFPMTEQKHCPGKLLRSAFAGKQNDKPGYVVNGHLSSPAVAGRLKRPT